MEFKIEKISPKGVIRIERTTNLTILSEVSEDKKSRITYEEVGGLQEEIKIMREIVELPLRHPELFVRLGIELLVRLRWPKRQLLLQVLQRVAQKHQ